MKKKTSILLILTLSIFGIGNAIAGGGLSYNKITRVAFQTGGFFMYADAWPNPNSCSKSTAIVLLATDSNYDKAYSLLLSAYMSGKSVSGYSDGCTTFDGQTYNTIRGFKYLTVK